MEDRISTDGDFEQHGVVAQEAQAADARDVAKVVTRGVVVRVVAIASAVFKPFKLVHALTVAEDAAGHDEVRPGRRGKPRGDFRGERCGGQCRAVGFRGGYGGRHSRLCGRTPAVGRRGWDQGGGAVTSAGGERRGEQQGGCPGML